MFHARFTNGIAYKPLGGFGELMNVCRYVTMSSLVMHTYFKVRLAADRKENIWFFENSWTDHRKPLITRNKFIISAFPRSVELAASEKQLRSCQVVDAVLDYGRLLILSSPFI